jgi:hypothetical protein
MHFNRELNLRHIYILIFLDLGFFGLYRRPKWPKNPTFGGADFPHTGAPHRCQEVALFAFLVASNSQKIVNREK